MQHSRQCFIRRQSEATISLHNVRHFGGFWSALTSSPATQEPPTMPTSQPTPATASPPTINATQSTTSSSGSALKKAILAGRGIARSAAINDPKGNTNVVAVEVKQKSTIAAQPHSAKAPLVAPRMVNARTGVSLSPIINSNHHQPTVAVASASAMAHVKGDHLPNFINDADSREVVLAKRAATSRQALEKGVSQIVPPTMARKARSSSVRYKADVNQGQHRYTVELMKVIKANKDPRLTVEESIHQQCDFLNARERLDLLRMVAHMSGATSGHRKLHKGSSPLLKLPKYWSEEFGRFYYFKESDLTEKSVLGTGPGGQATNRRRQTIQMKHIPSGMSIRFSHFTSLYSNRRAARAMLNLQIEQQELGEHSTLGRKEVAKERSAAFKAKCRAQLERKSDSASRKARHRHSVVGFLLGYWPIPLFATPICSLFEQSPPTNQQAKDPRQSNGSGQLVTISALLDSHASRWWTILSESFYNHWCRPVTVKSFIRSSDNKMKVKRRVCGWVIGATKTVPCWFCYVFPLISKAPSPLDKPTRETIRLATATSKPLPPPMPPATEVPMLSTFAPLVATSSSNGEEAEGASSSTPLPSQNPTEVVDSLMLAEAAAEDALAKEHQHAKAIYFEYLRQRKRFDIVARTVQYHQDQLDQLKGHPGRCKPIQQAVGSIVEAFGLFMEVRGEDRPLDITLGSKSKEATTATHSNQTKVQLRIDPSLWQECNERLHTVDGAHLTPIASAIFPHMVRSLDRLGMVDEATAIRAFFVRRAANHKWAAAMVELMSAEAEDAMDTEESSSQQRVAA